MVVITLLELAATAVIIWAAFNEEKIAEREQKLFKKIKKRLHK
jgi:hypothetical protein